MQFHKRKSEPPDKPTESTTVRCVLCQSTMQYRSLYQNYSCADVPSYDMWAGPPDKRRKLSNAANIFSNKHKRYSLINAVQGASQIFTMNYQSKANKSNNLKRQYVNIPPPINAFGDSNNNSNKENIKPQNTKASS
eukprot:417805_1